jgi:arsenate reductase
MLTVYTYAKCSTCRSAVRWLEAHGLDFEERPIRETPPAEAELKRMLGAYGGKMTRLFNTSSQDYRDRKLNEKLPAMSEAEAFALLRSNGNLVKRPFLLGPKAALVGFKEAEWQDRLKTGR